MTKFTKKLLAGALILTAAVTGLFAAPNSNPVNVVEALQQSFRNVTNTLLPSVVEVDVTETKTYTNPFSNMMNPFEFFFGSPDKKDAEPQEFETQGLGSGVIVRKDKNTYYVLTNNHVAGAASKITIKLNDGRTFDGKLVGSDARIDIALVSFEAKESIPVAKLGDSDEVMPGDICLAFGAPLGYSQSVTQGIVSATGRSESSMSSISDYIQTDAAINQGNSGGPLVNIYGEVIGINTWIASSSGGSVGLGFAIPINNVKTAIDSIIDNGKVIYGWVGVSLLDVNEEYKEELGVAHLTGAFAAEVFTNSPAFKGGIRPGDFIVELNDKPVKSVSQLVREVGNLPAGSKAKFGIIRGGKRIHPDWQKKHRSDLLPNDCSPADIYSYLSCQDVLAHDVVYRTGYSIRYDCIHQHRPPLDHFCGSAYNNCMRSCRLYCLTTYFPPDDDWHRNLYSGYNKQYY